MNLSKIMARIYLDKTRDKKKIIIIQIKYNADYRENRVNVNLDS